MPAKGSSASSSGHRYAVRKQPRWRARDRRRRAPDLAVERLGLPLSASRRAAREGDLLGQARRVRGGAQRRARARSDSRRPRRAARGGRARSRLAGVRRRHALAPADGARGASARARARALRRGARGSVLLQIGQRSMKRLWRQKVGMAPLDIPVCAPPCAARRADPPLQFSGAPTPGPTCCGGPSGPSSASAWPAARRPRTRTRRRRCAAPRGQVAVDHARALATLVDRPHDQRLAAARVAGGEHAVDRGRCTAARALTLPRGSRSTPSWSSSCCSG